MNERAGDDQLLAHSVTVALHQLVSPLLEIEQREQLIAATPDLFSILSVQSGDEAKNPGARQLLVDERRIGNEPQLRFRLDWILCQIVSADLHCPRRRLEDARDHSQRRGLARAVRAE